MHTYVDLYFDPQGTSPLEVADWLKKVAGLSFIVGEHDLVFAWITVEEFRHHLEAIHAALRGTGTTYRVRSTLDDPLFVEPVPWPPPLEPSLARHPAYEGRSGGG